MIWASDIRWKIFAYAFSLWENRCCLTHAIFEKTCLKVYDWLKSRLKQFLWVVFDMILPWYVFFEFYFSLSVRFCFGVFLPNRESDGWAKWRLALLWWEKCSMGSSKNIRTMKNYKNKHIVTNMFVSVHQQYRPQK